MKEFYTRSLGGLVLIFLLFTGCGLSWTETDGAEDEPLLWIADWNLENYSFRSSGLEDGENDRKREGILRIMANSLNSPDIIAVQEVMDDSGICDDGTTDGKENFASLARGLSEISGKSYAFASLPPDDGSDGGKPGANIRTGFLYDSSRVSPAGPPVRWKDPAFDFCRKPLILPFLFRGETVYLINVHLTSRLGGEASGRTRLAQAEALSKFLDGIFEEDRRSLVLLTGDFNDEPRSKPLGALMRGEKGLVDLIEGATYSYRGNPCQLDHMLASPALSSLRRRSGILSVSGKIFFPSDHRPLLAGFFLGGPEGE